MRSTRTAAASHAAEGSARSKRLHLTAWLLGLLAIFFYVGFIAWNLLRGSLG